MDRSDRELTQERVGENSGTHWGTRGARCLRAFPAGGTAASRRPASLFRPPDRPSPARSARRSPSGWRRCSRVGLLHGPAVGVRSLPLRHTPPHGRQAIQALADSPPDSETCPTDVQRASSVSCIRRLTPSIRADRDSAGPGDRTETSRYISRSGQFEEYPDSAPSGAVGYAPCFSSSSHSIGSVALTDVSARSRAVAHLVNVRRFTTCPSSTVNRSTNANSSSPSSPNRRPWAATSRPRASSFPTSGRNSVSTA
jgi:hypothetical protein